MNNNFKDLSRCTPTDELGCISYQSYLDAIRTVRQYHIQVEEELKIPSYRFLFLQQWAKNHPTMSVRLKNIIKYHAPECRIMDFSIPDLKKLRGVGKDTMNEFLILVQEQELKEKH